MMNIRIAKRWIYVIVILLVITFLLSNRQLASYLFGEVKYKNFELKPGNLKVPHERSIVWRDHSAFADSIYNFWAAKPLPDWKSNGKTDAPRVLLAKLLTRHEISETNNVIRNLSPNGVSGSTWALNKEGDYDFTLTVLTAILYLFGDNPEILYPDAKDHLLNVLLTEKGNKFRNTAPRTLGLVLETENHILMTEGSRYLKNRWEALHGNKDEFNDNVENGMEDKILAFLGEMKKDGLYEFNSNPYIGYTITALLNLEAFASEKVKTEARNVLDYMNWCYALGSFHLNHYPPMRRRYEKSGIQEFANDYQTVFMKSWLSYSRDIDYITNNGIGNAHALIGVCMPYRPADKVVEMLFDKGDGYFVKLGHGPDACPEIYSAGEKFLLSAGGVNRGKRSLIVTRPITLFLNDKAENLSEVIHLSGPGNDFMLWNNTGVYKNFACAAGPIVVPESFIPVLKNENWSIYSTKDNLSILVYSTKDFGLVCVFKKTDEKALLSEIMLANPDIIHLKTHFRFPGGKSIDYDVLSPRNKWVIVSADDKLLNLDFDKWPLIDWDSNYN
jgi:hypothetical protein